MPESRTKPPPITLSADGYVRLTLDTLLTIQFFHSISGVYEDAVFSAGEGARFSITYGYTEWISATKPLLSLGWDWQLGGTQATLQYSYWRVGSHYSNVMLVDEQLRDLGAPTTAALLESLIDLMRWQTEVDEHIVARYA
ncbi:DUF4902 domain-containing protein [Advenella sp. EE-W14]|uniref:DUF4902 domain-containing protein n=1 Tax=Advenella sp. EE-W14 TaxID=2722705 RepID=UPI00145D1E76|nr:DUF4902 domain-containing protein [Advenella sp. EE-W14]